MTRQCTARSKQTGRRCRRRPRLGADVCHMHAGAAPQVERKRLERLAVLVDPTLDLWGRTIRRAIKGVDVDAGVRVGRDVLDRNGMAPPQKLVVQAERQGPDLSWLTDDELDQVEAIFARAEARKLSGEPAPGHRAHAPTLNGAHVIALDGADDDDVDEVEL